jgi:hypothetical protein
MPPPPQEYSFKVQVPGKGGQEKTLTVGKAELDMSRYVGFENAQQNALVPITFKVRRGRRRLAAGAALLCSRVPAGAAAGAAAGASR